MVVMIKTFSIEKPWRTFLVLTVLLFLLALGAGNLQLTTDFRTYFSADNPQLQAFEKLEADFNKQDTLVLLLKPEKAEGLFAPEALSQIAELSARAWQLPYARRVDSLTNYQRIRADQDDILVADLYAADASPEELSATAVHASEIAAYVLQQPALHGRLVSNDLSLTQIIVSLTLPDNDPQATAELVSAAKAMLADTRTDAFSVQLLGTAVINVALAEAVERDMAALIPGSYLLIFTALFLLTRSLAGAFLSLTLTLLTVAAVFGALGWSGATLTPVVGAVPSMIMIIVVADCLHILV